MSIKSTLRKEGIVVIKPFDTLKVNIIAKRIANKPFRNMALLKTNSLQNFRD